MKRFDKVKARAASLVITTCRAFAHAQVPGPSVVPSAIPSNENDATNTLNSVD